MKILYHPSPYGRLRLLATERGIAGIYFEQHAHYQAGYDHEEDPSNPFLSQCAKQLDEYFQGKRLNFDIPLDVQQGTAFQQKVWHALRSIPYGETRSYAALAEQIGHAKAVRALGAANGRNPISIIVPCHRVIASSGNLQGYAGGLENKRKLLELEKSILNVI
jgi:methylated-DNA-[protein]-cysteine S-methyltransferase